jgi:hypothetical protein
MIRLGWWALVFGIAAALANGCDSGRQTGSETHWFTTCERDEACSSGLSCICGVCTARCASGASCGATASTCASAGSSDVRALCEAEVSPPYSVCVPTCTAAQQCPSGLRCVSGVCGADARAASVKDASSDAPLGTDSATPIRDGGSPGVPESAVPPRRDSSVDGGGSDARPDPVIDGAAGATGWGIVCDELPLTGATELASGVNVVLVSAPSGVYFGSPRPLGDGVVLERLKPNGETDKPLGDRRINYSPLALGVGGIFYLSDNGSSIEWFSPSEARVVSTWTPASLVILPLYPGGNRIFGIEEFPHDGGGASRIVEFEPAPDAGAPLMHRVGDPAAFVTEMPRQMTADDSALYFETGENIIYELAVAGSGPPRPFEEVGGHLWGGLQLLGNELLVTREPPLDDPGAGGVVAIDRSTHAQRQLAVGDLPYQSVAAGGSVYYATPFPARGPSCYALRRVPLAGGAPETLGVSGFMTMVASETDLYVGTFRGLFKVPLRP